MQRHEVVNAITEIGYMRRVILRERNALDLRINGLVRRELDFQSVGPDDETPDEKKSREKHNKSVAPRITRIVKDLKGVKLRDELTGEDRDIADYMKITCGSMLTCVDLLEKDLKQKDKELAVRVKDLPEHDWWCSHVGLSSNGLALLTADAGDIARFDKESQLWKRMGVAVINGERQRKVARNPELAIEHGYNCDRRSTMYVIVDSLMMSRNKPFYEDHPWMNLYRDYKVRKLKEGDQPCVAEARAKRRLGKRILRDLFIQVNGSTR